MESLLIAWRVFLDICLFAFPQLLGILFYFRLRRVSRWLAVMVAALAPAVIFFCLARIFLLVEVRRAYASSSGNGCGMPALGAVILLFFGTAIQLGVGVVIQAVLAVIRSRKVVV